MYLNKKLYKSNFITKFIKNKSFIIFLSALNKNSQKMLFLIQRLQNLNLFFHKINNKITKKIAKNSIFYCFKNLFNNSLFLLNYQNKKVLIKSAFLTNLNFLFPIVLIFKLNNKFYVFSKIKNLYSFHYFQNKKLLVQFCVLKLKHHQNFFSK